VPAFIVLAFLLLTVHPTGITVARFLHRFLSFLLFKTELPQTLACLGFDAFKGCPVLTVHHNRMRVSCFSSQSGWEAAFLNLLLTCQSKTTDKI
jgi:hypothetical protein